MSVVGFDLGNHTCYVAVARGGGIDVIANEYSDRVTPSFIGFTDKCRVAGHDARQRQAANPRAVVYCFKRLIGRKFSDSSVRDMVNSLPFPVVPLDNDRIGVKVTYLGKDTIFSVEEIMAMMLLKLKAIAEVNLKRQVKDCVISVPSFYTDTERRAMLDAAAIADLNCLRLINDTTAIALAYGIFKTDLPDAASAPRNVAFVDFGHTSVQVAIVAFNNGVFKVLSTASDPYVGGRQIDQTLLETFAKVFVSKYKVDPRGSAKPYLRLLNEIEKLKKQMSANNTKLQLAIECFMEDKDVVHKMSRAEMEEDCKWVFERIEKPLREAIVNSGLTTDDIHSVEIVGGSSRVPLAKDIVQNIFGKIPSTTLNADEAVARGCALQCAILSPTFRVREYSITDVVQYPITLQWKIQSGNEAGNLEVFPLNHNFPASKMLTFYRKEAFDIDAIYSYPNNIPYSTPHIARFTIHDVMPTAAGDASKVKVLVQLNIHGIIDVKEANLIEKIEPTGEIEPAENDTPSSEEKMDTAPPASDENKEKEATAADSEKMDVSQEAEKQEKKKKVKVKTISLPIKRAVNACSNEEISKLRERELQMQITDKNEKERQCAQNSLEDFILNFRRQLNDELRKYTPDDVHAQGLQMCDEIEDWLFDFGDDATTDILQNKHKEIRDIGVPIYQRKIETETRPNVLNELGSKIQHYSKILDLYAKKDEQYNHIEEADMQKVHGDVQEAMNWYNSTLNTLAKVVLHQDAPITVEAIKEKYNKLKNTCEPIVTKPKPKVEPPKEDQQKEPTKKSPKNKTAKSPPKSQTNNPSEQQNGNVDVDEVD